MRREWIDWKLRRCQKCGRFVKLETQAQYLYHYTSQSLDDGPTGVLCLPCLEKKNTENKKRMSLYQ